MPNPMKANRLAYVLAASFMAINSAAAEDLSGAQITTLVAGKMVSLNTPFGISLPLRYRTNGVVVGDVSGISAARMFAPKEEGRWWIQSGSLCQQWPSWYKGRQFCFKIRSLGEDRLSWLRDDGASGTARIAD